MYVSMFRDLESGLRTRFEKGKRWWRLVAILTFRSFVMLGGRGENESNNLAACFPQDS